MRKAMMKNHLLKKMQKKPNEKALAIIALKKINKSYMQTSGTNVLLFFCAQILGDVKTLKGPFANGTIMIVK